MKSIQSRKSLSPAEWKEFYAEVRKIDDEEMRRAKPSIHAIPTTLEFINKDRPKRDTIVDPWLYEKMMVLVYGGAGIGKSWFALYLAASIAAGKDFGPWPVRKPFRCLYVDGEMANQDLESRIAQIEKSIPTRDRLLIWSEDDRFNQGLKELDLPDKKCRTHLADSCFRQKIKVLILDNISALAPGIRENNKEDWSPINKWAINLRKKGITTIFIHHTGKGRKGPRGTSAFLDHIDIGVSLTRSGSKNQENTKLNVHFGKTRILRKDSMSKGVVLSIDSVNGLTWTFMNGNRTDNDVSSDSKAGADDRKRREILKMLEEGRSQSSIAKAMGITEQAISKRIKKAKEAGLLTDEKILTRRGREFVFENKRGKD